MLPAFLITLREVIEATLIVATILGILYKLKLTKSIKTVVVASVAAILLSIILLVAASFAGLKMQELYSGRTEELIEGSLMIISAAFITWAVFFLHNYFGKYKVQLLQKLQSTVEENSQKGLFILAFTAIFREGFEIVLFLTTIFLSTEPTQVFTGFVGGVAAGLMVSVGLFTATFRMPVYFAFRVTSALLILFASGLLARGAHEFVEAGIIPEVGSIHIFLLPEKTTFVGASIKSLFGLTQNMDFLQLALYFGYTITMVWWVYFRKSATFVQSN